MLQRHTSHIHSLLQMCCAVAMEAVYSKIDVGSEFTAYTTTFLGLLVKVSLMVLLTKKIS